MASDTQNLQAKVEFLLVCGELAAISLELLTHEVIQISIQK